MFSAEAVASALIWVEMSFMAAFWPPQGRPISARVKYITLTVQCSREQGSGQIILMMMMIIDQLFKVHDDQRGAWTFGITTQVTHSSMVFEWIAERRHI